MCDHRDEVDAKIDHYRLIETRMTDQALLDGIKKLIEELQTQKAALHHE